MEGTRTLAGELSSTSRRKPARRCVCVLFVCVCECVSLSVVYVYNQSLTAYLHLVALHLLYYTVDAERGSVCSGIVVVLFDRLVQGSSEGTSQTSPSWRQGRDAGTHTKEHIRTKSLIVAHPL